MASLENLPELILSAAEKWRRRQAFRHISAGKVTVVTYGDIGRLSYLFARAFWARGLRAGDYVVLWAENSPQWVMACLGAWRLGLVVVPVDAHAGQEELTDIFARCLPKTCLAGSLQFGLIGETLCGCPVSLLSDFLELPAGQDEAMVMPPPPPPSAESPALLAFTSGRQRIASGVLLSHGNILANVLALVQRFDVDCEDRLLSVLPLSHMFEFTAGLLAPLSKGSTIVYCHVRSDDHLKEILKIEKVSVIVGSPVLFQNILSSIEKTIARMPLSARLAAAICRHAILSQRALRPHLGRLLFPALHRQLGGLIKFWAAGGAPVPSSLVQSLSSFGITLLPAYTLTEASPVVAASCRLLNCPDSVGHPLAGVEVNIAPAAHGSRLSRTGEILVRGPNVMLGYFKDERASAEALKGGWLHTGDQGYLGDDGRLHVLGSSKSTIVTAGGDNIQPEELEEALNRSRAIKECCVLAREGSSGTEAFALIVPQDDLPLPEEPQAFFCQEVSRCLSGLADYKRLSGFDLWAGQLPRTAAGKLKRAELARLFTLSSSARGPLAGDVYEWTEDGRLVLRILLALGDLRQRNGTRAAWQRVLYPGTTLTGDLGIDSFGRLELSMALEEEFSFEISEETINNVDTVGELVTLVGLQRLRFDSPVAATAPETSESQASFEKALRSYQPSRAPEKTSFAGLCRKIAPWPEGPRPNVLADLQDEPAVVAARRAMVVASRAFLKIYNEFEIQGVERLSIDPPFIVAANHTSHLDTLALFASFPPDIVKIVHPVAHADTFFVDGFACCLSANLLNAIPFDRFGDFEEGLRQLEDVLRKGKILIVFPEGTYEGCGELAPFKSGVARLSAAVGCPIVPAYIEGAQEILPRHALLPRCEKLSVRFGTPLYPPPAPADLRQCRLLTERLQESVLSLKGT